MHVIKPSRVFPPAPVVDTDLHIRSVFSFVVEHSMAAEATSPRASVDDPSSEHEPEVPAIPSTSSVLVAHDAAAEANAKKKADDRARMAAKRKADKVLTMPQSVSVSTLQGSLDDALKKRDAAKKEAKVESNKVKLARKRVERVKAKAKELSNNDLYEVYLMRMQEAGTKSAEDASSSNDNNK